MIDYGAEGAFIDQNFTKNFEQKKLDHPLTAKNLDGMINKKGTIKKYRIWNSKSILENSRNDFTLLD